MIALDSTFLVDYLDGEEATGEFIEERARGAWFAPTLALFEVYRGALRSAGPGGIEEVVGGLEWVDPLPLTEGAAREGAAIEAELREAGTPINLGDVLIAGVCREAGASLATRDGDFDRVEDLEVVRY